MALGNPHGSSLESQLTSPPLRKSSMRFALLNVQGAMTIDID